MNKKGYVASLSAVMLMCVYPVIMGMRVLSAYIANGYVNAEEYPKYVIPYTPIAIALILCVALLPLLMKLCERYALVISSVLGVGLFLLFETLFEKITLFSVTEVETQTDIGSWQMFSCYMPPGGWGETEIELIEHRETINEILAGRYNPMFKFHFYIIAILIVLAVIGVVYGFAKIQRGKTKPLIAQTAAVAVFIGLCILACFTAFYRTGDINLSALSSGLMSVFFIIFGVAAGVYAGSLLYFKKPVYSRIIPAIISAFATIAMYIGELILMDGELFKHGSGLVFEPIFGAFAIVDIAVILLSGAVTFSVLFAIKTREIEIS